MTKQEAPFVPDQDTTIIDMLRHLAERESPETDEPAIPEIQRAIEWASENMEYVRQLVDGYHEVFRYMSGLGEDDLAVADRANTKLKSTDAGLSSSEYTLRTFLTLIPPDGREDLEQLLARAFTHEVENPIVRLALTDLTDRMEYARRYKKAGGSPRDGDPVSDEIIWGFLQIEDNEALIHFLIAHYFERYVCQAMRYEGLLRVSSENIDDVYPYATSKDGVLNAMTEAILLRESLPESTSSKDPMHEKILDLWLKPKDEGGLGWISKEEVEAFKEAASEAAAVE